MCRKSLKAPRPPAEQQADIWYVLTGRLELMVLLTAPIRQAREAGVRCPSETSCLNAADTYDRSASM